MEKTPRDKESGLPKAYVAGLSTATAKARAAHFSKANKLSDRDPEAYKPAPGDATAKTKPSKDTLAVRKMMKEGDADNSLSAKAKKTGISLSTLKTVYKRGVAAWNSGHRPGTTPSQWGHARVNSYIRKGSGTYHGADKDLRERKDDREYGYEGEMVMSQLKGITSHAEQLNSMLKPDTDLPEWVQSKITLAYDYLQTAADYMATEMKEDMQIDELSKDTLKSYAAKADARTMDRTIDNPKAHKKAQNRTLGIEKAVKKVNEESDHSVHVKTYDSHGEKQMNSPDFKKHVTAHGGKLDYASDKGAAFKFASHSHAAQFHRGVQSKFKELDSEHDMHEDMAMGAGPVNVAANVADPKNKKLFAKPIKRFKNFKAE